MSAQSLQQELDAIFEQFKKQIPEDKFTQMVQATKDLAASGIEGQVLKVGDENIPDFELPIVAGAGAGESFKLSTALAKGPVVLVYYRGGWCPYCNMTLRRWQKNLEAFQGKGATVVALSPEKPDLSAEVSKTNELAFPILQDVNLEVAKNKLKIVFNLPKNIEELYSQFGIDLEGTQARADGTKNELPLPATFAIVPDNKSATGRKVVYSFAPADYTKRADPQDVLATL